MKKKYQFTFFKLISIVALLSSSFASCSKDVSSAEIDLSYKMLSDKTWYLEYTQAITSTTTSQKTYVGQSTYFINFVKNLTTNDSDGLTGAYKLLKSSDQLQIQVSAMTTNGNTANFTYDVVSLGAKYMVLSYKKGDTTTKLYYSTQK